MQHSKTVPHLAAIFTLLLFIGCASLPHQRKERKEREGKMRPSEWFYTQRAYPDATFSEAEYFDAINMAQETALQRNSQQFDGFNSKWTLEGPRNIGGRINCLAVNPTDKKIILAGTPSGGLFRTIDGGTNWNPVFDNQSTLSIGDVAFAPSSPNIVFAGTGDPNITAYPFVGNGIYKSIDGGVTWNYSGLEETRIISKIVIHPTNPNIIFAAAMGSPFERNEHRGLYKSTDGGTTWTRIFFASNQAGIIDIGMSFQNPNIIYISSWERIRTNKESITHGPASRVYRTLDGGNAWSPVSSLPTTDNGRIGIAMSPTTSGTINVTIADPDGELKGIYRTTNSGNSWTNTASNLITQNLYNGMGWYFGKTFIAPNGDTYVLGIDLWRNKGSFWENVSEIQDVHVDMHDMAFEGGAIFVATDGGAYRSDTNGDIWKDIDNIPNTQCYHVSVSPHAKGKYWAGTQDNGTIVGNATQISQWEQLQAGDGFKVQFVPNVKKTYFISQQEGVIWMTRDSGLAYENATLGIQLDDRRGWDMPYLMSQYPSQKLYAGTEKVYRANLAGQIVWQPMSLDLTKGNIYGSQFHVISCLEESRTQESVLYAGTSDGNAWYFENNFWYNISDSLPNRFVTSIKSSPTAKNSVYVTHSGYKDNSNTPLIHISTNKGLRWRSIKGNLPDLAINDVFILPNHQDSILFVATDGGVYGSLNKGQQWQRLGKDMPFTPTYRLEIDTVNRLLVAATHGRSVMTYPLDSILYRPPTTVSISGKITLPNSVPLKRVSLLVEFGNEKININADANGSYTLPNRIPLGSSVKITPSRAKSNAVAGITTADLVAIQRHILAVQPLSDAYKVIAADANLSNTVTSADIVVLRRMILALSDTLPQSWRFVPRSHSFPTPQKPFPFPTSIQIQRLEATRNDLDFIGIKVGDTNGSVSPE